MSGVIHCQGLRKVYGEGAAAFEAVRAVTFTVDEGEFVTLLGPSGCGKSTLLMLVGGLETLSGGSIQLSGTSVSGPRSETGILFQDPMCCRKERARQRALIDRCGRPRSLHRLAHDLLQMMGSARTKRSFAAALRQRVSICRAQTAIPTSC
jgi:NitT/TauT family transport system ATP-binding protein